MTLPCITGVDTSFLGIIISIAGEHVFESILCTKYVYYVDNQCIETSGGVLEWRKFQY